MQVRKWYGVVVVSVQNRAGVDQPVLVREVSAGQGLVTTLTLSCTSYVPTTR